MTNSILQETNKAQVTKTVKVDRTQANKQRTVKSRWSEEVTYRGFALE